MKSEVELAVMFGHGYRRNFTLPADILGSNYSIDIKNKVVVVKWKDYEVHELLIAHKITGSPKPGKNTILNRRDEIVFQEGPNLYAGFHSCHRNMFGDNGYALHAYGKCVRKAEHARRTDLLRKPRFSNRSAATLSRVSQILECKQR